MAGLSENSTVPRVSVLMPAYNAESTIGSAVQSILRQSLIEIELVIVDDGSSDRTPHILDSYAQLDSRVRVLHQPNGGIIQALNAGIPLCKADLIARMDADDVSHPRRLELQAEMMDADPSLSVCSCRVRMFPRRRLLGGMVRYEEWLNSLITSDQIARDIFVESPVAHPSVMLRKHELIELGCYQERGWAEDYDLWMRYHIAGKRFAKVDRILVCWRQTEGRLTFTDSRYSVENFLRAKAHYLARLLEGEPGPIILWGAGKTGRRLIKHLLREGLNIEAVVDIDPAKVGRTLRSCPIIPPDDLTSPKDSFVISAVSSNGARQLIRLALTKLGFTEGPDFICAA